MSAALFLHEECTLFIKCSLHLKLKIVHQKLKKNKIDDFSIFPYLSMLKQQLFFQSMFAYCFKYLVSAYVPILFER